MNKTATDEFATTNIRIERRKLKALKIRAVEENVSLSALLRELIDDYLEIDRDRDQKDLAQKQKKTALEWAGTSLGKGFSGTDHDSVLYGNVE